jgi:hypothetical protein
MTRDRADDFGVAGVCGVEARPTRDRKGQVFVPGFLSAAAGTPIMTAGELPGGGALFSQRARAVEREQLSLMALESLLTPIVNRCGRCGMAEAAGAAGLCSACNELADERGEA